MCIRDRFAPCLSCPRVLGTSKRLKALQDCPVLALAPCHSVSIMWKTTIVILEASLGESSINQRVMDDVKLCRPFPPRNLSGRHERLHELGDESLEVCILRWWSPRAGSSFENLGRARAWSVLQQQSSALAAQFCSNLSLNLERTAQ